MFRSISSRILRDSVRITIVLSRKTGCSERFGPFDVPSIHCKAARVNTEQSAVEKAIRARMAEVGVKGDTRLAEKAGVGRGALSDLMKGKRTSQPGTRVAVSLALGWDADYIDRLIYGLDSTVSSDEDAVHMKLPPSATRGLTIESLEEMQARIVADSLRLGRKLREAQERRASE